MRDSFIDDIKRQFRQGSALTKLIIINIAVFLLINIVDLIFFLFKIPSITTLCGNHVSFITYWISVPADLTQLLFRPWTIFSYMFAHESVMHIVFNMIIFYFSGKIFLEYFNEKKLATTYILGGLCGALVFIFSYNIFPIFRQSVDCAICLGASASVMAVMIAIASFVPNYTVHLILLGPVKLKYIAIIYVVIDIISIKSNNAGGHIAHLGGAMWGYFYIFQYKKGKDYALVFGKISNFLTEILKRKSKLKVAHKKTSDSEYNFEKAHRQQKIDFILDKISKSGYESLSKEEKEFLFKASNKIV